MRDPAQITHNGKTLAEILRLHGMWLREEIGGERADLTDADLTGAILRGADLTGAILRGADLTGAILRGAILRGASLLCLGNKREIRTLQFDTWNIGYTADTLQIGCQRHAVDKWRRWETEAGRKWIAAMDKYAVEWADRNLALVLLIIDTNPATPTGHEKGPPDDQS